MAKTLLGVCGAVIALLLPAAAQDGGRAAEPLKPLRQEKRETKGRLQRLDRRVNARKVQRLVNVLGSEDEEARKDAEERLEEMGKPVLPILQRLAKREKSPEARWRIKKVIRAIQGKGPRIIPKGKPPVVTPQETENFLEEMRERLRRMMEEMEKDFGPFFGPGPSGTPKLQIPKIVPKAGGRAFSSDESVQIQIGPQGVQVETRKKGPGGKEEVKRYRAKSVEEFKKLYPGIARKYHIGGNGVTFQFGTPPSMDFSKRLRKILDQFGLTPGQGPAVPLPPRTPSTPGWKWWGGGPRGLTPIKPLPGAKPLPAPAPPGDKLGVYVEPVPDPLAQYLSLPPGFGLMVREVLSGSLAERAGVQPNDIILTVNGRKIRGVEDVKDALSKVPGGGKVTVTVIRKGRKMTLAAVKGGTKGRVKRLKKVKV